MFYAPESMGDAFSIYSSGFACNNVPRKLASEQNELRIRYIPYNKNNNRQICLRACLFIEILTVCDGPFLHK
jgi:hypothetical protein